MATISRRQLFAIGAAAVTVAGVEAVVHTRPGARPLALDMRFAPLWPFASDAPANTPLGSGAKFEDAGASQTANFLSTNPAINCTNWSVAVALAEAFDPVATIHDLRHKQVFRFYIPPGTKPTGGTDRHVACIQPDGDTVFECYKFEPVAGNIYTAMRIVKNSLRGNGIEDGARASNTSILMGLLRADEIRSMNIPHSLTISLPARVLRAEWVWPAHGSIGNHANTYADFEGDVPLGTMFALPPSVDLTRLGLSPAGLALGLALQNYGANVMIGGGNASLYAELAAAELPGLEAMRNDWHKKLFQHMRRVTNNTVHNVGGGGLRRAAFAPPLLPV